MAPTLPANVHFDRALSGIAMAAWPVNSGGYIAPVVMPSVPVTNQSDRYPVIATGAFLRKYDTRRAPGAVANKTVFGVSSDQYFAEGYALANELPIETLVNADDAFQIREHATLSCVEGMKIDHEYRVAQLLTTDANNGGTTPLSAANVKWSGASAAIMANIATARNTIRAKTGMLPNTAIVDYDSWQAITTNPHLLEFLKYNAGAMIPDELIARQVFRMPLENIRIATSVYNTAAPTLTEATSLTGIWGNMCWLGVVNPPMGLRTMTYGLTFDWRNPIYPGNLGAKRDQYTGAGQNNVEVVEVGGYMDEKVIAPDLGYLIKYTL